MRTEDPIIRAFELARCGTYRTITEIRATLRKEGYLQLEEHFSGNLFKQQLKEAMMSTKAEGSQ